MNKKRIKNIFGISFIIIGIILLINSQASILGGVIGDSKTSSDFSLILGLTFFIFGIFLLGALVKPKYREISDILLEAGDEARHQEVERKAKIRKGKRIGQEGPIEEAKYFYKEQYKQEHGRYPSKNELKAYVRVYHERGEISEDIFYGKRRH